MMLDLIREHRAKGVVVDTNILLLFIIGSFDRSLVGRHKRAVVFAPEDFDLLVSFLHNFDFFLTTPCILAEVSNLSAQIGEPQKSKLLGHLSRVIPSLREHHTACSTIATEASFKTIGLTDSGIIEFARLGHLVLTDDLTLYQFLNSAGADVINFNHIRTFGWK